MNPSRASSGVLVNFIQWVGGSFINSKAYRRMQNDKHSSNLQLYSNIISFQNILFRSYSNKKSFSTLQKPNSKQQAIKNCLLLPSPLEPQRQLSHKNSSLLRSHSLPDGPSKTPQTTTSPKFTSSSSHQRLPPTPNFSYERNHITKGSLHP